MFDAYFDTLSPEQIVVGNASSQNQQTYYDLWMSFPMRSLRKTALSNARFEGPNGPAWTRDVLTVSKYTISGKVDPFRDLAADATLDVEVKQGGARMVLFELSRYLQLKQVDADGQPLEYIQNEAVEGSEMSRRGNDVVAVVFPQPLQAGAHFALRFSYAGSVLSDAGGGLLYAGARGTWYPNRGIAMTNYDVTFRFPEPWTVVATGKLVSLDRQGGEFVAHWITEKPIPIAGFNMGVYVRNESKAGNVEVDAYSARGGVIKDHASTRRERHLAGSGIAAGLAHLGHEAGAVPQRGQPGAIAGRQRCANPDRTFADAGAVSVQHALAGGKSQHRQPGMAGTGFSFQLRLPQPGATRRPEASAGRRDYLWRRHDAARTRPPVVRRQRIVGQLSRAMVDGRAGELLFADAAGTHSPRRREATCCKTYRNWLAAKSKEGRPNVEAGPVTLGVRLSSSHFPNGYEIITYSRGTWLIHMLRCMLRDASRTPEKPDGDDTTFLALLRNIVDRYQGKEITNTDFQQAIEAVLPQPLWFEDRKSLEWFFDGWVNGTAFPQLEVAEVKMAREAGTVKISGVIRQKLAPPDLVTSVPVYGVDGRATRSIWAASSPKAKNRISAISAPAQVKQLVLDPYQTVLTAPQ